MRMKQYIVLLLVTLLVAVTLTGCSSDDGEEENAKEPRTYKDPVANLPETQPVDFTTFTTNIVGRGWTETGSYLLHQDGDTLRWAYSDWTNYVHLFFANNDATLFYHTDGYGYVPCHTTTGWQYDEQTNMVTFDEGQQMKVLSVNETELHVIRMDFHEFTGEWANDISIYAIYVPADDSKVQWMIDEFWVNLSDMHRPMGPKDLQHKWVLTSYTDNDHNKHHVTEDRSDDQNYIRFEKDTFVGKAKGVEFSGTYMYDGHQMKLIPDTPIDHVTDNPFLKNIWSVKNATLQYASYLTMDLGDKQYYNFVRGIE